MPSRRLNIALCSPNKTSVTETFIDAHKNHLDCNTFYYYGGKLPHSLEGYGMLDSNFLASVKAAFNAKLNPSLWRTNLLIQSFVKNKVDVILAEYGPTGVALVPVSKALNIPLVVHFHGSDISVNSVIEKNQQYFSLWKNASHIIVVSHVMRRKVIELGCPIDKVVYSPCGPMEEFYKIDPYYEGKVLVSIGRFVNKKAPQNTIFAFSKVLKDHPDAILKIAGDGPLLEVCRSLIQYLSLHNSVHLLGVLNRSEIIELLSSARAFVLHSVTANNGDMEGTPVSIMEAAASSLPIISTKHGGIPDVIDHALSGYLVEEHDISNMAKHIHHVLSDSNLARSMGLLAKKNIIENFSFQKHIGLINSSINNAHRKNIT